MSYFVKNVKPLDTYDFMSRINLLKNNNTAMAFSEFIGIKPGVVYNWASGASNPTTKHLQKISEAFGVDMDWLLTGKTSQKATLINTFFINKDVITQDNEHIVNTIRRVLEYGIDCNEKHDLDGVIRTAATLCAIIYHPNEMCEVRRVFEEINVFEIGDVKYILSLADAASRQPFSVEYRVFVAERLLAMRKSYIKKSPIRGTLRSIFAAESPAVYEKTPKDLPPQFLTVPLYADTAAAGSPLEVNDHDIEGEVILHRDWCPHPDKTVCVRVDKKCDSMLPLIAPGSIVSVDTAITDATVLDGKVVAIRLKDDGVAIKRLRKIHGNGFMVMSDNVNYPPMHLTEEDRIIGLVTTLHSWIG